MVVIKVVNYAPVVITVATVHLHVSHVQVVCTVELVPRLVWQTMLYLFLEHALTYP